MAAEESKATAQTPAQTPTHGPVPATSATPASRKRQNLASGTPWEPRFGYSRAVRVGDRVWVSGTTATDCQGRLVGKGDAAAQMEQALRNVEAALQRATASEAVLDCSDSQGSPLQTGAAGMADVVRTRIYITRHADWEAVGEVHGRWFKEVRPATSLVVVAGLVDPDMLVEVEAEAVVGAGEV